MTRGIRALAPLLFLLLATGAGARQNDSTGKGFRQERAGWVYVHLEGSPHDVGYQHGYLLAPEIDDGIRTLKFFVKHSSGHDWDFFRSAARRIFWPKLDAEYRQEIKGIAAGLRARGKEYDATDVTALNSWIETAWYYIPEYDEKMKGVKNKGAGEHCSAFIATGSYTKDGKIVMAHNAWVDYIVGERWRVIADINPAKGHRILMDTFPGFIHSGDDFVENSAGLMYTETTIGGFKGFDEAGVPEFQRARKAAQYAGTIDDFVRIMKAGNNGGYANDWLVGDTKANEVARVELGLKNVRVWRTTDGIFYGSNFPSDDKLTKEETNYDPADSTASNTARKLRWEAAGDRAKGTIDAELARAFLGDHYDVTNMKPDACLRTLCGHGERDPKGIPDAGWGPYYPVGAVQGKVTTSALVREMKLWARMGFPCGGELLMKPYLKQHPEYAWQGPYLHDIRPEPWTLFSAAGK